MYLLLIIYRIGRWRCLHAVNILYFLACLKYNYVPNPVLLSTIFSHC